MTQTKIKSKEKTIARDYTDRQICDSWVKRENKKGSPPNLQLIKESETTKRKAVEALIQGAEKVLLVASPVFADRNIANKLKEATMRGVRLYLLVSDYKNSVAELSLLVGNAFVRTGLDFPGTLLIADPEAEAKGIFLNDSLRTDTFIYDNLAIPLEQEQIAEMYTLFCHWIWNKASLQIITKKALNKPQPSPESPYGIIPLVAPNTIPDLLKSITANGEQVLLRNLTAQSSYLPNELVGKTLIVAFKGNEADKLRAADAKFEHILGLNGGLINKAQLVTKGKNTYLFPVNDTATTKSPFLLKLTKAQAKELADYRSYLEENASFRFFGSQRYADLLDKTFYRLGALDEKLNIKQAETANKNAVEINLAELQNPDWDAYVEEQNLLACTANYPIELKPLSLPKGAKQDPLYGNWETVQASFLQKIGAIGQLITVINEKQASFGDKLKKWFKGFGIGKATAFNKIQVDLEGLKQQKIDLENARKLFIQVNEIIDKVSAQEQEVADKIKDAEGREIHESKVEAAKKKWVELKEKIHQSEAELEQLNVDYCDKKDEKMLQNQQKAFVQEFFGKTLEGKFIPNTENESLNKKAELNFTDQMEWAKIKSTISETWGKLKKDKKVKSDKDFYRYLENLNRKANNVDNYLKEIERQFEQDKKPLEKAIRDSKARIPDLESTAKALYTPPKSSQEKVSSISQMQGKGKKQQPKRKTSLEPLPLQIIPKEALPAVGVLFNQKGRYLRIKYWEDFLLAQQEAERLKVKAICV